VQHITVCICTFKRPLLLRRVIEALRGQVPDTEFVFSIVVCDNDYLESAKGVVLACSQNSPVSIDYIVESRRSIALARNKAVEAAKGDFIAFLDDDEVPGPDWLSNLFSTCARYAVDGVLGAAVPLFDGNPPSWLLRTGYYQRTRHRTGTRIDWRLGRTGNALLHSRVFDSQEAPFDPRFVIGEDQEFFRKQIERGHRFVWCDEAVTREIIPPRRWKTRGILKSALLRGKMTWQYPTTSWRDIVKSVVAAAAYGAAVPLCFLTRRHLAMRYLVKLFDHAGLLMAWLGVDSSKETYNTF
jgi:succinoglycan biosynthesis protein ExoM